jgi:eukaryotic-like serine/threonine-protein kinase
VQQSQILLPGGITVRDPSGDRYIIESLLGKGLSGAVYLVKDRRMQQNMFALKEVIDPNKRDRERFIFEGEILKRLNHPALPHVYRVFEHDKLKRVYLLMDYIKGKNLETLRKEQPGQRFTLDLVLALMAPIVDALIYLHKQDPPIVHRDIKPANIIVPVGADEAVLVDFGSAKEYVANAGTTTISHLTPGYAALEQYGSGTTTRTDIYGLGATLYVLLTGIVPLDAMSRVTRSKNKGPDPLKPVHQLAPEVPTPVSQAIQRAMNINSDGRYETIEEFWQELKEYATNEQAHLPRVTSADMPQALPEYEGEHTMPGTKRWIVLFILLALLVTFALATELVSYVWGLSIFLLLCMGILLLILLPKLHRR